ncbi:unnamed protein product [Cylicostephanus goldi]|uniref:Uncharacterized protein n=1 Tax=Cylicostephanus goldi TaxID=71465 RepID=A0A3P6RCP7_CYLGO|nr:unnamed protein product [Cylicostephanus goldi]
MGAVLSRRAASISGETALSSERSTTADEWFDATSSSAAATNEGAADPSWYWYASVTPGRLRLIVYHYLTVNYQMNFVDFNTGATQHIESRWQKFKRMAKQKCGINNSSYADYLKEFLWRKMFGKHEESLYNFWRQVADLYPVSC